MAGKNQRLELTWYNKDKALIPTENGKYGYTWVDPRDPRYCETHTLTITDSVVGTQAPKEEGVTYSERADLEPQDDNLLILGESGDVLEALTRVPELRDKYLGKVKCVYIDPPFNTAQTFANYEDNLEHSVWLTMMRDRLLHLRDLLSEDGSIWVHLDDVENHRMRLLLDEVFGSNNFVAEMQWEKTYSPRNDSTSIPAVTDSIVVYRKSESFTINKLSRTAAMDTIYKNPDADPKGPWTSDNPCANHGDGSGGMCYAIQSPLTGEMLRPPSGSSWRYSQSRVLRSLQEWAPYKLENFDDFEWRAQNEGIPLEKVNRDVCALVLVDPIAVAKQKAETRQKQGNWPELFLTGSGRFRRKSWLANMPGRMPVNLLPYIEVGHSDGAKKEIKALFPGETPFSTPKPERLLERIIHIATNPGDIVLDVFAGSGTTAAVAQKMGRRWVTCELVEDTFNRFTRPRLEKVVNGEDMGGISTTKGERVDDTENGLPEGMAAEDAQKFTSFLNKIIKDHDDLKKSADVKAIKALSKTVKTKDTVNWRGGGGFTVARLAPSCYDYDPEMGYTSLTPAATGETLIASVAANLGFYLTPEDPRFDGRRNNQHLAVVEGVLTEQKVGDLMTFLPEGHSILFAATMLDEGIRDVIRSYKNGSRTVHIPLDLFPYSAEEEN
ncbi:site-specific DNA-methyltransferase [Corynebacterium striatum]